MNTNALAWIGALALSLSLALHSLYIFVVCVFVCMCISSICDKNNSARAQSTMFKPTLTPGPGIVDKYSLHTNAHKLKQQTLKGVAK